MRPRHGTMLMAATALAVLFCAGSAQAVAVDDMLSISPPADITTSANMPCGGSYCAQVYFTFTASGGTPPYNFVCGAYPGSLFLVGSHNVGCLAQDSRGNSTPIATFTITVTDYVHDVTPPVFQNVPGPITATADDSGRAIVYFPPLTAVDDHDGSVPVHCQPSSGGGDAFQVGVTTVTCTAQDSSANTATASFTITVTRAGTAGGTTTTTPSTTTTTGTTTSAPTTPLPTATTTVTTTVTQPSPTSTAPTPVQQSLQEQIAALSAEIAVLTDRMARLEKASDAALLAYEQAIQAGDNPATAADIARGTGMNVLYGLGDFAP